MQKNGKEPSSSQVWLVLKPGCMATEKEPSFVVGDGAQDAGASWASSGTSGSSASSAASMGASSFCWAGLVGALLAEVPAVLTCLVVDGDVHARVLGGLVAALLGVVLASRGGALRLSLLGGAVLAIQRGWLGILEGLIDSAKW